jgi:hypothetical protein
MIGEIDDPYFDEHLRQGPYIVIDDAAKPAYRNHPRVHFIPGHPVLGAALPELFQGFGIEAPGKIMSRWQKAEHRAARAGRNGAGRKKVLMVAKPLAALGAAAALFFALSRRLTHLK